MSTCKKQINLTITPPNNPIIIKTPNKSIIINLIHLITRQIPYPPNFNKRAAKIIDPATGASTWALGSHR